MSSIDFAALGLRPMSQLAGTSVLERATWVRELVQALRALPALPLELENAEGLFKLVERSSDDMCCAVFSVLEISLRENARSNAKVDAHLYGIQRAIDRTSADVLERLRAPTGKHAGDLETPRGGLTGPERRAMARGALRRTGGGT